MFKTTCKWRHRRHVGGHHNNMAATSLSFESPGIGCKPAILFLRKSPSWQWFEYQISLPEERFKPSIWFATSIDSSIESTDRQNLTATTLAPRIANPSSLFLFSILRQFVLEPFIDITAPELYKVFQYEMPSKTTKTNTNLKKHELYSCEEWRPRHVFPALFLHDLITCTRFRVYQRGWSSTLVVFNRLITRKNNKKGNWNVLYYFQTFSGSGVWGYNDIQVFLIVYTVFLRWNMGICYYSIYDHLKVENLFAWTFFSLGGGGEESAPRPYVSRKVFWFTLWK